MTLRCWWAFDGAIGYPEWSTFGTTTGRDGIANHANGLNGNSSVNMTIPGGGVSSAGIIVGYAVGKGVWSKTSSRPVGQFNGPTVSPLLYFGGNGNELIFNENAVDRASTSGLNWLDNTDHYLEVKYVPHPTTGNITVRVDGVTVMNFTGRTAAAAAGITGMSWVCGAGSNAYIDDMYLLDTVDGTATDGRPNNDFLGDCKVTHLYPSGPGANTGWTPSVAPNWGAVDENPVNTTDYVAALGASNLKDTYDVPDLLGTAQTVYGVRLGIYAQKTDAGAAGIKPVIREGGADAALTTLTPSTVFSALYSDFVKLRPNSGGVFAPADVNAMQIGVQSV